MKLLFYINSIHEGGAERVIVNLCNYFCNANDVVLVTSFKDKWEYSLDNKVKRHNLADSPIKGFIKRNAILIISLRKIIKKENPDCVISFMGEPNLRVGFAKVGLDTKWICSVRNDPSKEYKGLLKRFLAKNILSKCDGCVFQTNDAMKWFQRKLQSKSKVIMNAVTEDFFKNYEYVPSNKIATCGRLVSQKNHKLLIKAFSLISKDINEDLFIYGDGNLKNDLINYSEECGVRERVHFEGQVKEVFDAIRDAKIFVLSSDFEGMPNALLEAMTMGIPCISTDCPCGGPKQIIANWINGVLVPVNEPDKMSKAIFKLLSDSLIRETLRNNAKSYAASNFNPDAVFKEWQTFIDKIVSI